MKVGINGMGRIGRLALRAAFGAAERQPDDPRAGNRLDIVHLNEIKGGAAATAHLLAFDSVQGRWREDIEAESDSAIRIGDALEEREFLECFAGAFRNRAQGILGNMDG